MVTCEPLFFNKANNFFRNSCFTTGYDTFVRIIDKKYYEGNISLLIQLLEEQKQIGTSFGIAGRINSKNQNFEEYKNEDFTELILKQMSD